MAFSRTVNVGDIWELRVKGFVFAQQTISVFHYRVQTVPGGTDAITLSTAINTAVQAAGGVAAAMVPVLPSTYSGDQTENQRIFPKNQRTVIVSSNWAVAGTAGAADTANIAQVVTRRTSFAGRSQVSDIHIPVGTVPACITAGLLTAGQKALLTAWAPQVYQNLVLLAGTVSLTPVIYHRGVDPISFSVWDEITGFKVQTQVRTMRRRNIGIGI